MLRATGHARMVDGNLATSSSSFARRLSSQQDQDCISLALRSALTISPNQVLTHAARAAANLWWPRARRALVRVTHHRPDGNLLF